MSASKTNNVFLAREKEKSDLNQYWYSANTIATLAKECDLDQGRTACLSTPSIFFSLAPETQARSIVLDFDKKWEKRRGFVFFDFNSPTAIPEEHHHQFDMIVVDPPFITREVWLKYAEAVRLLARGPDSRIICTTIAENREMMDEILAVKPKRFKPSIPHLVYQYETYANFDSDGLNQANPEIPE